MKISLCVLLIGAALTTNSLTFAKDRAKAVAERQLSLSHCNPKKVKDEKLRAALEAANAEVVKLPAVEIPGRGKVPLHLQDYRCDISHMGDGSLEIIFHNIEAEAQIARDEKNGKYYLGGAGGARAVVKEGKVLDVGLFQ